MWKPKTRTRAESSRFEAVCVQYVIVWRRPLGSPRRCGGRMDSINRQRSGRRMSDWMDNQDVCLALKISPRTLQTLRDSGKLPHSKINNRIYYRPEDVERLIANDV